jgi:hypothetical protein
MELAVINKIINMKNKTLYIIIAILVSLNIGQFVYFYSVVSDLKKENEVLKYKLGEKPSEKSFDPSNP